MSNVDLINLIAAVASLVLSIVAIWLAFVFYRMSVRQAEKAEAASMAIGSSVDRLEKLFSLMYSDTFGMMKDTVSDMRGQLWSSQGVRGSSAADAAEEAIDERIKQLEQKYLTDISTVWNRLGATDSQLKDFQQEITPMLSTALHTVRLVESEAKVHAFAASVMKLVNPNSVYHEHRAGTLFKYLAAEGFSDLEIQQRLFGLRRLGIVSFGSLERDMPVVIEVAALTSFVADRSSDPELQK